MLEPLIEYWSFTSNALWHLFLCCAVVLVAWIGSRLVRTKLIPWMQNWANNKQKKALPVLVRGFSKPAPILVLVIGLYIAARLLPIPAIWSLPLLPLWNKLLRITLICLLAWGLVGSSDLAPLMMKNMQGHLDLTMDKTVTAFLNKILKILVTAFAVVIVLGELDFNVNGLIAGMGLAGLTVSLAAKESATNFFNGLVIILERPFTLGDWISVGTTEGTVEDVGFRSTKIRTLDGSLVILPNTTVCSQTLVNGTQRTKRLFRFTLGVTYNTSHAQIEQLLDELRSMLQSCPEVDTDSVQVRLQGFGGSSIDILVHCYVLHPDLAGFLQVQEQLDLQIMDIMQRLGVDFAFPSQSIYIEKQ